MSSCMSWSSMGSEPLEDLSDWHTEPEYRKIFYAKWLAVKMNLNVNDPAQKIPVNELYEKALA